MGAIERAQCQCPSNCGENCAEMMSAQGLQATDLLKGDHIRASLAFLNFLEVYIGLSIAALHGRAAAAGRP
eukprot:scaffold318671_cov17-Prasinocladus_malaysianus.AAC.1